MLFQNKDYPELEIVISPKKEIRTEDGKVLFTSAHKIKFSKGFYKTEDKEEIEVLKAYPRVSAVDEAPKAPKEPKAPKAEKPKQEKSKSQEKREKIVADANAEKNTVANAENDVK